mmetsp:Transcript_6567/g.9258  ORF Transcript_6567/g.9258 Transcript_6567/m.9258 type:complete len:113 (-) Transcript_6567:448-786(-)
MRSIRGRRAAAARTKGLQQIIHRLNVLACFGSVIYIFAVVFVALVAFRTLNADETKKYSTVIEEEKENYRLQEDVSLWSTLLVSLVWAVYGYTSIRISMESLHTKFCKCKWT